MSDLAERVRVIMQDPTRRKTHSTVRTALMGGLGRCGACGAPLISAGTKTKTGHVLLYACSRVKGGQTEVAGHPAIRRSILDAAVREAVVSAFVMGKPRDFAESAGADLETVERDLAALGTRKSNLQALVAADAGIVMADVLRDLGKLNAEIEAAAQRKAAVLAASAHARMLSDLRTDLFRGPRVSIKAASSLAASVGERWDALDLDAQRQVVRDLVEVTVLPGRGKGRVRIHHLVVDSLNED